MRFLSVEIKMGKDSFCTDQSVMIKCLWSEIMTNYIINREESVELLILHSHCEFLERMENSTCFGENIQ